MSLTLGRAPFGREAAGRWNFERRGPAHVLLWEPYPRRLRVVCGGEFVADSTRVHLLHETGLLPVAYFPEADIRPDVLELSDRTSHCPFKGDARYFHLGVEGRSFADLVWTYPEPIEGAPPISGYFAFYADRVERMYEEDREVIGHLRDPYHRVDVVPSSRHVRVVHGGQVLAESRRPRVVFETGLPPRFYVPRSDAQVELGLSPRKTVCGYKGVASWWSGRLKEGLQIDLAWSYEAPLDGCQGLEGHVCFDPELVETTVDGAPID